MSFWPSHYLRVCLAVAALGWSGLPAGKVLAADPVAKPEATATLQRSSATNTNLASRPGPRNGLQRLEEQLSRSFEFLKPSSSLEGVPAPSLAPRAAPPVLSKRAKEALERRKNWMFASPDELGNAPKTDDFLNLPEYGSDGLKPKSLSPIERFYLDLEKRATGKTKRNDLAPNDPRRLSTDPGATLGSDQEQDDPNLPGSIKTAEKELRKLLDIQGSMFAPAPERGTRSSAFADFFGQGEKPESAADELAHKAYMKGFQDWLDHSSTTPPVPGAVNPFTLAQPSRLPVAVPGGLDALAPLSRPSNFDPSIGAANPTLLVGTPQDVNAKVLNQWNPLYTPPRIEPQRTPTPAPVFDVPRRKF